VFHPGEGRAAGTMASPGIGWLLEAVAEARR
jgi:hypothetical protein